MNARRFLLVLFIFSMVVALAMVGGVWSNATAQTLPTTEPVKPTQPPVISLPSTGGGAPLPDTSFPWITGLAVLIGIAALGLGVRAYQRRPR